MDQRMDVSCSVSVPGGFMELNNGSSYRLHGDTRASRQVSMRRTEVSSAFAPGSFTVHAVPNNVVEVVAVRVTGSDHGDMRRLLGDLVDAFTQPVYTLSWDYGEDGFSWLCQMADYTEDTRREFQHARMAVVTFQVPRYPALVAG